VPGDLGGGDGVGFQRWSVGHPADPLAANGRECVVALKAVRFAAER